MCWLLLVVLCMCVLFFCVFVFFFFKQKTAYEMRISDWSSDVCSSDLLAGFDGDVLILYGDVPLVTTATMRRMLDRLHEADSPAAVVLGFRPADPLAYGRVIAGPDGIIEKMVEFKDATDAERAVDLCNSDRKSTRLNSSH